MHLEPESATVKMPKPKAEPLLTRISADEVAPCLYLRMRMATKRLLALYEARMAESGVTMSQFGMLVAAAEEQELTMSRLAEKRELSLSTLSRTLRPLEELGWLEIFADAENGRVKRVRLTRAGRVKVKAAFACWKRAQAEAAEIVSPRDVERVLRATESLPA